ncbi:hypothetical protein NVV48_14955 [Klebsiella pneumoniae]|nr:hypothetical protein [Klebsiella pneumoniae]
MKQTFLSGATLAALVMLVALPLVFIVLQAIFPHLAPVRSGTPLAASRRCWPILSCRRCSAVRYGSPPAWRWSA